MVKIWELFLKILQFSKYPKIAAYIRTFQPMFGRPNIGFEGCTLKKPPIFTVFPIYSSKLHAICPTSNIVHPPFKGRSRRLRPQAFI